MTAKRQTQANSSNYQLIDVQKTLDSIAALRAQAFQGLKDQRARLIAEVARIDEQLEQLDVSTRAFSTGPVSANRNGVLAGTNARSHRGPRSSHTITRSSSVPSDTGTNVSDGRRTPAQLKAIQRSIVDALAAMKADKKAATTPTCLELVQRIPQTTTRELARPIRHLIAAGTVKAHGVKSGTRYFLAAKR